MVNVVLARLPFAAFAGWPNHRQREVNEYLVEENQILQRRRLAVRGRRLGRQVLSQATIVTPDTILRWPFKLRPTSWRPKRSRTSRHTPRLVLVTLVLNEARAKTLQTDEESLGPTAATSGRRAA